MLPSQIRDSKLKHNVAAGVANTNYQEHSEPTSLLETLY